ncbi:hypothetical protein AB4371_22095 [Vibrio sp. 10N.261.51.A3]|uniref:hypothetical protein n=1 Tax=unclassified Vibrio TaxID=2614977 RepID=UPI0035506718
MNLKSRINTSACLFLGCIFPLAASAAPGDQVNATINVTTTIAAQDFKVRPVGRNDFSGVIANLVYDEVNDSFSSFNMNIESTFSTGLRAQLLAQPSITNGVDTLPLDVTIDNNAITHNSSQIDSTPPSAGTFVAYPLDINIGQYQPIGAALSSGAYSGSVQLVFEDSL